jgi:hypothetical protein
VMAKWLGLLMELLMGCKLGDDLVPAMEMKMAQELGYG